MQKKHTTQHNTIPRSYENAVLHKTYRQCLANNRLGMGACIAEYDIPYAPTFIWKRNTLTPTTKGKRKPEQCPREQTSKEQYTAVCDV